MKSSKVGIETESAAIPLPISFQYRVNRSSDEKALAVVL